MSSPESSRASSRGNISSRGTATDESDRSGSRPESAGGATGESEDERSSSSSERRDDDTNSESSRGNRSDVSRQDSQVGQEVDSGDSGREEASEPTTRSGSTSSGGSRSRSRDSRGTSERGSQQNVEEDDAASSSSRGSEATASSERSEDSAQRIDGGDVIENLVGGDTGVGDGGRRNDRLSRGGFSPSEAVSERSGRSDGTNSAGSSKGDQSSDQSDGRGEPNERSGESSSSRGEISHTPDREQSDKDVESGSDDEDRSDDDSRNTDSSSIARSFGTPRGVGSGNHRGQAEKKTRGSVNRREQRDVSATRIQRNVRKRQARVRTSRQEDAKEITLSKASLGQQQAASTTVIQRNVRRRQKRHGRGQPAASEHDTTSGSTRQVERASATKIQRNVRRRQARAMTCDRRRQRAATTIQAGTRGRHARRKLLTDSTLPAGRARGPSDTPEGKAPSRKAGECEVNGESGSDVRSKEETEAAIATKHRGLAANQVVELEVGSGISRRYEGKDQRARKRERSEVGEEEEGVVRKTEGGNLRGDINASHQNGEGHKGASSGRTSADSSGEGIGQRTVKRDDGTVGLSRATGSGKRHTSEEHQAATRIQRKVREHVKRTPLRQARDGDSRRGDGGGWRGIGDDPVIRRTPLREYPKTTNVERNGPNACAGEKILERREPRHAAGVGPAARSPSPSQLGHQGSTPWMSPGKAAANAATAAAKEAAKAAAASVRAAEAAADAAEAAEAAAEAEEEMQLSQSQPLSESRSQGFRSPPAHENLKDKRLEEQRRECSPARSAFYLTEGGREEGADCLEASGSSKSGRSENLSMTGAGGEAIIARGDRNGGYARGAEGHSHQRGDPSGSAGSEEQMLKRARDQARRHARDRRARARAKEEESKRELQTVQAELAKAEELRDRQAMVEKSALEAKRARVLEDMKRRQLRLQRLQEEEGRGGSHPSSPSRSSSTDAAASERLHRRGTPKREPGGSASYTSVETGANGGVTSALSLPPVARGRGGHGAGREGRAGRKPRHVSAFRERILEERRVRKEVDLLKRKELEDKHSRQAEYAAKIRAQAKRALAAEQRRAQEDAERESRQRRGQSSTVDRTPIAIKRPKRAGEWGVFSYAPNRPPEGAAPRKAQGLSPDGRPAVSGFGSSEKVHQRLGSSELVERMRKERARATEASRARAAAAAAAIPEVGGRGVGGENRFGAQQDGTRHRPSEPNGTAYKDKGEVEEMLPHRPLPPSKQRSGGPAGGRGASCRRVDAVRQGEPHTTPQRRYRPAVDGGEEDIHALYEKRLAALEQRLAGRRRGGDRKGRRNQTGPRERSSPRDPSGASDPNSAEKELSSGAESRLNGKEQELEPPGWSRPHGGTGEWREENNPFGYKKLSTERVQSSVSVPSSGFGGSGTATLSRRGSDASGGEDLEGLSTIYMGPIAHKMAELRAENG